MGAADDIKARLDIVDYIRQFVDLRKQGRTWKACCPFHSEKTPSFVVDPDRQTWRCYGGCADGGDLFSFVVKRENTDFKGALELLARAAGVELQRRTPQQVEADHRKEKLIGLLDAAATIYHRYFLEHPVATEARAYARSRGLNRQTVETFRIGYVPNEWRFALDQLVALGYSEQDVLEAGVAIHNPEKDTIYDRFRYRLMIPICDGKGQVIGFGGRAMDSDEKAKYINSPQSLVFDKSATLFALHLARPAIRESETAVIVEGYMDAITAHQFGYKNVVAQMGTALTEPQIVQISKLAQKVVLALDSDAAGVKATMRGLDMIRQAGAQQEVVFNPGQALSMTSRVNLDLRVLSVPDAKDPDDFIRAEPEAWPDLVNTARPVADYVIEVGIADLPPNAEYADRERTARQLLPMLIAVESDSQRYENVSRLALRLRLNEKHLMQWAQEMRQRPLPVRKFVEPPSPPNLVEPPELQEDSQTAKPDPDSAAKPAPPGTISEPALEKAILQVLSKNLGWLTTLDRNMRKLGLEPLEANDFQATAHRELFACFRECIGQIEMEHEQYFKEKLPDILKDDFDLLAAPPFDPFIGSNPAWIAIEFAHLWHDDDQDTDHRVLDGLQYTVLRLRQLRLSRETVELKALQSEVQQAGQQGNSGGTHHQLPEGTTNFFTEHMTRSRALARLQAELTRRTGRKSR